MLGMIGGIWVEVRWNLGFGRHAEERRLRDRATRVGTELRGVEVRRPAELERVLDLVALEVVGDLRHGGRGREHPHTQRESRPDLSGRSPIFPSHVPEARSVSWNPPYRF